MTFDPQISEWGNPSGCRPVTHAMHESEPWELKHLSTKRKRKRNVIPLVVASERGLAQTNEVPALLGL